MASGTNLKAMMSVLKRWVDQSFIYCFKQQEIGVILTRRTRFTLAQVNAGVSLLPAIPGFCYRLVSCRAIAVGGAATTGTTIDLLATAAAASRKLVAFAQASLTQSTVLQDGTAGAAVLADGASYTVNDKNTAVTIGITGSAFTVMTSLDVIINYMVQRP